MQISLNFYKLPNNACTSLKPLSCLRMEQKAASEWKAVVREHLRIILASRYQNTMESGIIIIIKVALNNQPQKE